MENVFLFVFFAVLCTFRQSIAKWGILLKTKNANQLKLLLFEVFLRHDLETKVCQ